MINYNKLLVVIDPTQEQQKALGRAMDLARKTGASLTAFLSIYDFSYEMTTMLSVDERETMRQAVVDDRTEWLTELVDKQVTDKSLSVDVKVVWHNRPFESIIYETLENQYDLIIKGTQGHGGLKSVIFTPTDWHLMRKAPVPVLLVKEHEWPEGGNILAAVNVGTEDEEHKSLNQRVTRTAMEFAKTLNGRVNLVNSYPGTPVNIAIEIPEFDPASFNQSVRNHHQDAMKTFASTYGVTDEQCFVQEGLPEDVIPQVAKDMDAELVVIGTVGRHGISAALIGNTAEHVIGTLDCDVLAIKPEGFVSPLQK
ncbi:universal stress protein UspE [Bowmanella dokdonensis]|uniref:Universal stress protein UspE n=1 Tax=Bowmanella dokdonensis TaxID=751969 RepID=A0A939ILI4_9ALTE|nr:universal stress protein UspE [Bowmanella dokdonensis]MBN7824248.1 universal stress protein UspE [Bowmanella dokdonensis]